MDANSLAFVMTAIAIGLSWLALKSYFFGIKLIAGMFWFVMFIYFQTNVPTPVVEGSGLHTALLVICIGAGLMIVLSGLGTGIKKTQNWNIGTDSSSESSEGFKFKIPKWMRSETGYQQYERRSGQDNDNYRDELRTALRRGKENNRRR